MDYKKYDYNSLLGRLKQKGITQELLAKKIGVNTATINQKLNNKAVFKQNEIVKICEVLDISADEIGNYFFTH